MSIWEDEQKEAVVLHCLDTALHRVMRRYWQWADRDDVRQELLVWVLSHEAKVEEYLAEERTHSIVKALEHAGIDYGQREKAARSGYKTDDIFYWQAAEVESLLPAMFSDEARLHPPQSDDDPGRRSSRPLSEGGNWLATLADLSRAYKTLDLHTQNVLYAVFAEDKTRAWVAKSTGVSDTTISNTISKGIRAMHRELGGERPVRHRDVTGSRRAMTNAASRALTDAQYDEE